MRQYRFPRVYRVTAHTSHVGPSTIFVAIPGTRYSGNDFVAQAIRSGAGRVILQRGTARVDDAAAFADRAGVPVIYVDCARQALARYSAHAYGYPHNRLNVVGITGTKGKTTTASLCAHILHWSGFRTALISSVGTYIGDEVIPTSLTTPQADDIYALLHYCCMRGITHVVIEVAAQALTMHRVDGILFDTVIVTNISHEHGEFYGSHTSYIAAKQQILSHTHASSLTLINGDDQVVRDMRPQSGDYMQFGFSCDIAEPAQIISLPDEPICCTHPRWTTELVTRMYGHGNAYNVVAATLCAQHYHVPWPRIVEAHRYFPGISGRMEEVSLPHGAVACLDYAHSIDSFHMVLSTLRDRFSCVWVVFGVGGERDRAKRPQMAHIASQFADYLVLTSDNPRGESLETIMHDLRSGVACTTSACEIRDRKKAILWACENVPSNGVVAILGKGRENYQIVDGVRYSHNDYTVLMQAHDPHMMHVPT